MINCQVCLSIHNTLFPVQFFDPLSWPNFQIYLKLEAICEKIYRETIFLQKIIITLSLHVTSGFTSATHDIIVSFFFQLSLFFCVCFFYSRTFLDRHCLGILFSNKAFPRRVLGLAWRGDPAKKSGICQKRQSGTGVNLNSLFITLRTGRYFSMSLTDSPSD